MLIIGFDPGKSTGLVVLHGTHKILVYQGTGSIALQLIGEALDARDTADPDVLIGCERFITPPGGHRAPSGETQQLIGRLEQLIEKYSFIRLYMQSPSDAHRLMSNKLLQQIGMNITASDVGLKDADDARMAMRHALLCMMNHRFTMFQELIRNRKV